MSLIDRWRLEKWTRLGRRSLAALLVAPGLLALAIVSLALTVLNLGFFFRIPLHGLIPLLILVSAYGLPAEKVRRLFAYRHSLP